MSGFRLQPMTLLKPSASTPNVSLYVVRPVFAKSICYLADCWVKDFSYT
jgi:hypothetical protein